MSDSYCWRFRVNSTYNKHRPEDLKPYAHLVTWRVKDLTHDTFSLVGFVQFMKPYTHEEVLKLDFPAEYTASDLVDYHANFHTLSGGFVISWGKIVHILRKPPVRLRKRKAVPPRSKDFLVVAALDSSQRRISLTKLAASEMGLSPPLISRPYCLKSSPVDTSDIPAVDSLDTDLDYNTSPDYEDTPMSASAAALLDFDTKLDV